MTSAICVRCGSPKGSWDQKCLSCGLDPDDDVEIAAKSYMLSLDRYDAGSVPDERMGLPDFGENDLRQIGERIRGGTPYAFKRADVHTVVDALEAVRASRPSCLAAPLYLIRLFLPIIILFVVLIGLGLVLRHFR